MMNILKNFQLNETCTPFSWELVDWTHLVIDEFLKSLCLLINCEFKEKTYL